MIQGKQLILPWDPSNDPAWLRGREWLVTNGLGGYSSGTLAGIPARKYHGLFVPNLASPKGRHIMISRCDEVLVAGDHRLQLGGAEFAHDRFIGDAHRYLRQFRLDHRIATWQFEFEGAVVEKSIVMPHGHNTVCVQYRLHAGGPHSGGRHSGGATAHSPIELHVRPFVSFRRHDEAPITQAPDDFELVVQRGKHEVRHAQSPIVLRMTVRPGPTKFVTEERDEHEFFYRIENDRGDPPFESAFSPGYFLAQLTADAPVTFIATTHGWERLEFDPEEVFEAERRRLAGLVALNPKIEKDEVAAQLAMAADQFIVLPGSRLEETVMAQAEGTELKTIYAGYHWFGDWGRDTMISFEGLTLVCGRFREAGAILRTFSHYVKEGLLPNLFPEGERQALYHTVDATLWYFHAISRYFDYTSDKTLISQLFPVLQSIIEHHVKGTLFNIHMDADGLISAAAEGLQLTWMDAKMGDWVVTPRRGKPVEIQALWYNALKLMSEWAQQLGQSSQQYEELAQRARKSFNERYWNGAQGCLFDVIDCPKGGDDGSIRPNQIFALSLKHPVLDQQHREPVLNVVRDRLLTRYGLRTLSSDHPDYKAHYRGDLLARDGAYHQGTVWPWLIGHFIDAHLQVHPDPAAARAFLNAFREHLNDAGIGSISEIFDAEAPYQPGGCIAQAWSVAEVLRAWVKTGTK